MELKDYLNLETNGGLFICTLYPFHAFLFISFNLVLMCIYKLNSPFFEQYKANKDPWPWDKNKEEWDKLFWRSMKALFINVFIVYPLALTLG